MQVVGAVPSETHPRRARARQRFQVVVALLVMAATVVFALLPAGATPFASAATRPAAATTTIYGPVYPLAQFPVQGKCSYIDSYGAPRSGGRFHEGVDLIAKTGQYVYAADDGTLTKQYIDQPGSLSGNGWRLTKADGTYFFYAHFSAFAQGLQVGSKVVAGQIIGYVGMTGDASTPHLHFEIHPGGGASINPTQSVKAIDACNVTNAPPVATNPTVPGQTAKPSQPTTTLAHAIRISQTSTPATSPTAPTTTAPTGPTTTVPTGSASESAGAGRWQFIEPVVVYNGTSPTSLAAGVTTKINVSGVGGVSSSTKAVLVRLSATVASAGSLIVHSCGATAPSATTMFAEAGPMAIGTTAVNVVNGQICLTSSTAASAKVTVIGQVASSGVGVASVATIRAYDSRTTGRLAANQSVTLSPSSLGATGAKAVTATVTIVGPSAAGTLSVGPCGGTMIKAPYPSAALFAFSAIVTVGASGVCVSPTTAADVIVDVDGVWTANASGILPVDTTQVFDSRTTGSKVWSTPVSVSLSGVPGAPAAIATAIVNVTMLAGPNGGSVFVWPCNQPQPAAAVGAVAPNMRGTFSVVGATAGGALCLAANQPVDVILEVSAAA